MNQTDSDHARPPRDNIVRAVRPAIEIRDGTDGNPPVMFGHFSVFDQWTEIDSMWEGNFLERIVPGSFTKSFKDPARSQVKVTFNHGSDPSLGDKILGPIEELREDKVGAYYEVALFDGIDPLLLNGLRSGAYGASFRFRVMREEVENKPKTSSYNPNGIPERTIKEVELYEFGPVTFPAYAGATAGVRSMTDEYLVDRLVRDPRLPGLVASTRSNRKDSKHRLLVARLKPVLAKIRATESLEPATLATIAQIDLLIDAADELVDTLMDQFNIPDPDETSEPAESGENSKRTIAPSMPDAAAVPHLGKGRSEPERPRYPDTAAWLDFLNQESANEWQ